MNALLKYSFVVDVLGGLLSIAYGVWAGSALWLWGGVAGLVFSLVWRRVQPRLLSAVVRKKKTIRSAAAPIDPTLGPLAVPVEPPAQGDTSAVAESTATRGRPAVDEWYVTPPKDGRLRYY